MVPQKAKVKPGKDPAGAADPRPTFGVLTARIGRVWGREFMAGVTDAAEQLGVNLCCFVGGQPRGETVEERIYELVAHGHLDGLILATDLGNGVDPETLRKFCQKFKPLPMLAMGLQIEGIPAILPDSYGGMQQTIEHLISTHGKRRIAFVRGPAGQVEAEQRYQAYIETLQSFGIPIDPQLIVQGDYSPESGRSAVHTFIEERQVGFDALATANDRMAFGALEALQAQAWHVPQHVALTGFDDVLEAQFLSVPLTTVCPSFYASGQQAVHAILEHSHGEPLPEQLVYRTELVVRWSCGCLPQTVNQVMADLSILNEVIPENEESPHRGTSTQRLDAQRQAVMTALSEVIGSSRSSLDLQAQPSTHLQSELAQLWESFLDDLDGGTNDTFLKVLDAVIQQLQAVDKNITVWHNLLSTLRRQVLPYLDDRQMILRGENLFQQARLLIGDVAQRRQAYQRRQVEQQEDALQGLSFSLATLLNLKDMEPAALRHFPALGITRCRVALLDENLLGPVPQARLMLDYDHGKGSYYRDGPAFSLSSFAPDGTFPLNPRFTYMIMPLTLGDSFMGILWLEVGPRDWEVYTRLRNLLSSAIFRASLVREREQAMQEIGRLLVGAERQTIELAMARDAAEESARRAQIALQETEGLFRAAQSILGGSEVTDICMKMTAQFTSLVQADRVLVFLVDHDQKKISLAVQNGNAVEDLETTYKELNSGISGMVFRTAQPVLSISPDDGIEPPATAERRRRTGTGSLIVVPLVTKSKVIGTVTVLNQIDQRAFNQHDVDLLMSLATQAAAAIDNAQMYMSEQARRQVAESLVQAGRKLSSSLKLDEVPTRILEQLHLVVPFERGSLMLRTGDVLRPVAQFGFPDDERVKDLRVTLREGDVFQQVAAAGRPVIIDDVLTTSGWQQVDWLPLNRSWMGIPLFSKDTVIGMLSLTRRAARAFTHDDALLVSTFALQAAIALENAGLYDAITRFNERLEQMVEQRTEQLNRALRELERLDKNKSDFIDVAAHELRTPLTVMKGYMGMMQSEEAVKNSGYLSQAVEGVLKGTDRLHEIVNSMLDVARIDSEILDLHLQPVKISSVVKRVQATYDSEFEERHITLQIEGIDGLPTIQADPTLMLKVVENVLLNAMKYTPDNGTITIIGHIMADEKFGDWVELLVKDTGIGIDVEHQELIFEKFFQTGAVSIHSSGKTKFKGGGPGLGLAIARGIVQAHRGRIWAESPGYDEVKCPGSCFHILLPVSPHHNQAGSGSLFAHFEYALLEAQRR